MSVPRPPAGPPPADLIGARPPFAGTSASAPVASPPTAAPSSRAASELAVAQAAMDAYAEPSLYPAGRFTLVKQIGKGAYGAVYFAHEKLPGGGPPRKVAIKHIVNAFVTPMDARRIYREIKVQAHFSPPHPNILPLLEVIKPRDALAFTHIYLVSELMETDLHRVVHSRQDLTSDHISYFVYQTLCALKHIHSAGILHRDLKPSNLLVNADCTLKMCDFGLARESDSSLSQAFTEYVVTRCVAILIVSSLSTPIACAPPLLVFSPPPSPPPASVGTAHPRCSSRVVGTQPPSMCGRWVASWGSSSFDGLFFQVKITSINCS